jgi:hypothetical protein
MSESKDAGVGRGTSFAGDEQQGVIGMGELLSASPKIDWLIEGVLPAKGRAMLYAAEKTGKSFVVLDIALHVATGKPWQGLAVRQGPVYYVASENAETFYERVQAWQKLHKAGAAETPFHVVPRAYNLLSEADVTALLDKLGPASLVIIDTLGRSMDGGDENNNADMNRIATAMDRIREKTGAAVLLVHHTGNEGSRARGASSLRGMVQTSIHLTRKEAVGNDFADGNEITLTCKAQTRAKRFDKITLRVKLVTVARGVIVPAIASGKASTAGKRTRRGKETPTSRKGSQRVAFAQVYEECGGDREAIMTRLGLTPEAFRQRVSRMRRNEQEMAQIAA